MAESNDKNIINAEALEVKAGKAEAQELAWKSTQVSMNHTSLDLTNHHWPSHGPPIAFFLCFIFCCFSDLKIL